MSFFALFSVMINLMCQLGWATGCLGVRSDIILGVSVRVFGEEVNIYSGGL